jgi:hypothetical protein
MAALLTASACEESGPASDWVSDNPGLVDQGRPEIFARESGDDDDGMREVLEADIVAVEGDRIYALSPHGGLSIVDAAQPDELELLGRWRVEAQPFELYVDDGRVFAMFTDYGANAYDEETQSWQWHTSSRLVVLDARDPEAIDVLGEFVLPGWIRDSRRVGEVLYVVTNEEGGCWRCQPIANTTITSLDISNPAAPTQRDQLVLTDEREGWSWGGPHSVASTDQRMYVAGLRAEGWQSGRSTIEVIDITDPSGLLMHGASLQVAGTIQNRWQMDEHDGVLRVVSQPQFWGSGVQPVVETFAIESSAKLTPLGSAALVLPRPEALRSVRFDGPRAYAITFEQVDPLFTIDLSDPNVPRQAGSLELPGWVEHIEPRGDRLLALGFDPLHRAGSLTVTLFGVADLDRPVLHSRVHFGGTWPELAEDRDRLHKAFTILEELDLVLVPYSGWTGEGPCRGGWQSGIQLVELTGDMLVRRGLAPSHGRARRALVHHGRMLGMSDKALESFDISDRDAPTRTDELALAVSVNEVAVGEGRVVRVSHDWWTGEAALDVVSTADAEDIEPLGRLALDEVLGDACGLGWWGTETFVHEGHAYLVFDVAQSDGSHAATRVAVFDVRDATLPVWVTTLELPEARGSAPYVPGDLGISRERVVLVGDALVFVRHAVDPLQTLVTARSYFDVVDVSSPGAPVYVGHVARPDAMAHGDLAVHGRVITSWHMQPAMPDGSQVRFFFERLYVSDPAAPWAATPVNVPGVAAAWDQWSGRLVTIDYSHEGVKLDEQECWANPRAQAWDADASTCRLTRRPVHLLRVQQAWAAGLDALEVEGQGRLVAARVGDDRLFAQVSRQRPSIRFAPATTTAGDEMVVVTGLRGNALVEASRPALPPGVWGWVGLLDATGHRLLLSLQAGLGELDAEESEAPVLDVHPLYGFTCLDLEVKGSTAYCAMGDQGLQVVPLGTAEPNPREALLRWVVATLAVVLALMGVFYAVRQRRIARSCDLP